MQTRRTTRFNIESVAFFVCTYMIYLKFARMFVVKCMQMAQLFM